MADDSTSTLEAHTMDGRRIFCFVSFSFCFAFTEAAALRESFFVLRYACAPTATRSYHCTVDVFFRIFFFFSVSLEMTLFFFPDDSVFYLVTTGWIFDISLLFD